MDKAVCEALEERQLFAFGLTTTSSSYIVDTGGGVVFTILRGGTISSTVHLGDMTSCKYNGVETLASFANAQRYSHYEQGLGSNTVVSATVDPNGQWIKITCDDSNETSGAVIQYYVAHKGDPNVYMASLPLDVNNGPGEGRYIAYMNRTVFPNPEGPSDNAPHSGSDTVSAIEGSDVFGHTDGQSTVQTTSSKFFNMNRRMIDNTIHGVVGSSGSTTIGAYMTMGNRETSSGGPFFKDIDFQSSSTQVEMYNCLFTGHTQTEAYRQGLKGPYAMMFTSGAQPALPDYSFLEGVGIKGLVGASQRGTVSGTASGVSSSHQVVVGLANSSDQYWAYANASTGAYTITGVMPGTYTETLYDNELEVGRKTVTITAGNTTAANIVDSFYIPTNPIFRIGTWDGTPMGFLNSENDSTYGLPKISIMHPSDTRMDSWTSTPNFVVGTNTDSQWPLAQFMGVNNSQRITFTLTAAQVQAMTLRIGITWGFSGARPKVTVNSGQSYAWTSTNPSASADLNSRGITRGTWRGVNQLYTYSIPASALVAGTNTIDLPLISGSYVSGQTWLSPNVSYDAIDLVPTTSASTPTIASVTVTPTGTISPNGTRTFTAVAKDASGNVLNANFDWSASRGTIDSNGNYIAPATGGIDTITATASLTKTPGYSNTSSASTAFGNANTGSGSTTIGVQGAVPIVATPPAASPNPAYSLTSALSVLGADDNPESGLTYTWAIVGNQPGTVGFSANGTNAAKSSTATFSAYGTYNLQVTIKDASNNTVVAPLTVNVRPYVARYLADESGGSTLHDSSPANNDATLTGSYSFTAGENGNALTLAGGTGGGYATLPTGIVSSLSSFTISAWINPSTVTDWMRIFDFGSSTTNYMFLTPQYGPNGYLRFAIKNGGTEYQVNTTTKITAGVWTHVAITESGSTGTLYVNGVQVGTGTLPINPNSLGSTALNYIGKSQFSADPLFAGSIDDFRIYGRALSPTEIAAIKSTTPPAAPTGLTATAGTGGQIALTWPAVAGATSYDLYRSTTSGGPYAEVASGLTTTNFTDTTTDNSDYYVVTAENSGGESARSAEASFAPPVPTSLAVQVATTGSLALSWIASPSAQSYTIARATSAGGPFATLATGITTTSYTDTGLTNGVLYYYAVSAVNGGGTGVPSTSASGTPTDLFDYLKFDESSGTSASDSSGHGMTGTLLGNGTPTGSTTGSGGLPTFSSTVKVGTHSVSLDGTDDVVQLPNGVVNGLTNFSISAWVNLSSISAFARVFDFGTGTGNYMFLTPSAGSAPRFSILTTGNTTEQQINGTSALSTNTWTLLTVTLSGTTGTLYVNGTQVGQNTAMSWNPSTLGSTTLNFIGKSQFSTDPYLNGKVDDFRVYSRALSSSEVSSLFANTLPATPAAPSATIASAQTTLSWSAISGATGYNIKRSTTSGGPYTTVGSVSGITSFTDTGLTNGQTYYYEISAVNVVGEGANSVQKSVTPLPAWLGTSSVASWNASTHVLTVTGATSIIADPGTDEPFIQGSGSAAKITVNPTTDTRIHVGGVTLASGASLTVTSLGAARTSTNYRVLIVGVSTATTTPTFSIDATSTLDLADNDMAILYGSGTTPLSTVRGDLAAAYDAGKWDLPGLTSSVAATTSKSYGLGYAEASTLGLSSFDNVTLGTNALLVKYTLVGDTTLSGSVTLGDYTKVVVNLGKGGEGWTDGNFDYSGNVGLSDYTQLILNLGRNAFATSTSITSAKVSSAAVTTSAKSVHRAQAAHRDAKRHPKL